MKGKLFRSSKTCVQSVSTYGTEAWAEKVENLRRMERTEYYNGVWICGVSLKDRKRNRKL